MENHREQAVMDSPPKLPAQRPKLSIESSHNSSEDYDPPESVKKLKREGLLRLRHEGIKVQRKWARIRAHHTSLAGSSDPIPSLRHAKEVKDRNKRRNVTQRLEKLEKTIAKESSEVEQAEARKEKAASFRRLFQLCTAHNGVNTATYRYADASEDRWSPTSYQYITLG